MTTTPEHDARIANMTFAKVYDETTTWPRRRKPALDFLRDLMRRTAQVPMGAVIRMAEGDTH